MQPEITLFAFRTTGLIYTEIMQAILIKNATLVNEDESYVSDVLIEGNYITQIDRGITHGTAKIIDAEGLVLMPGAIDDQVHFREPGLTLSLQRQ